MASTIATLRSEVRARGNFGSTTPEPTDNHVDDWLRQAFIHLIGALPPVKQAALTVGADNEVSLTHNQVFYVRVGTTPLYGWEWSADSVNGVVTITDHSADYGDPVLAWYVAPITITLASTATVDTTCIFGNDWLQELAVIYAAMQGYQRISNTAPTGSADQNLSTYRVLEDTYKVQFGALKGVWDSWNASMQMALQQRLMNGPKAVRENPYSGFINHSRMTNPITGG